MTSYSTKTRRVFLEDSGLPAWDNEARAMNLSNRKHIGDISKAINKITIKMTGTSRVPRKAKRALKELVANDLMMEILREVHNEGQ